MGYQVALSFEDGVTRFIECEEHQTVADASYRARINIPLDCRDGACGTCKAFCESGTYDGGNYIDDALTADEADHGFVLPCSMKPRSDLVLQIATTSAVAKTSEASYSATLAKMDRVSPTTVAVTLHIPNRSELVFLAGQYVNIRVPDTDEIRSFSFSNSPDADELTFLMKLAPGGAMSTYLVDRALVGDEITFSGPNGSFFLRQNEYPILFLAGGTGLAPILSMLRRLRDDSSDRAVHLVYGVSTDDDLAELETLRELATDLNMTWDFCVSDPASSAEHVGYVTSLIAKEHHYGGSVAVYLCGPPPMVESVRKHFDAEGIVPAGFYFEKFALSGTAVAPRQDSQPTVESSVVTVQPEQVEAVGVTVPVATIESAEELLEQEVSVMPNPIPTGASRSIAGQLIMAKRTNQPPMSISKKLERTPARAIAGQAVFAQRIIDVRPTVDVPENLAAVLNRRSIAGQVVFTDRDVPALVTGSEHEVSSFPETPRHRYEIGEEHPPLSQSDDIFEARKEIELGAVELVIGRLTTPQLDHYRRLAQLTLPYVSGNRLVDAAAFTTTNASFHEYLLTQTGNEHLVIAYQALGVQGRMEDALHNASWVHERCATDHIEIVEAFERGDGDAARRVISEHADRSKLTMRRAMDDAATTRRPAFLSPGRFAGKVVLLTGGAQGIGERTARRISAEGGTLLIADRSELVREVAASLTADGSAAVAVIEDLEEWEGAERVVQRAMQEFGRIDVAIHTVGGTIWQKPFYEYSPEQIQAEINRSLYPTLWACRAVAPRMIEARYGTIINVSSTATRGIYRVPYSAAKGGVNAITASLALELAPYGIRVAATAPGGTDAPPRRIARGPAPETEDERAWQQEMIAQVVDSTMVKRYGTLDEQASAIAFLASDEASYITGTVLPVSGGDLG